VREADRLASSIDRYVLSIIMGDRYVRGFMPCRKLVLKNPINPLFQVELPEKLPAEQVKGFRKRLFDALSKVADAKLRYLLLYALYEVLWIDQDLPVGPAETRVPTHTVFDHNYATAAALNWMASGARKGLLVGLDVAGVQAFVASSRKLRDAWVSSYLVSALVWYTILPLVEQLGPDVVVTPSLRLNPFFLHWLSHKVRNCPKEELPPSLPNELDKATKYAYMGDEYLLELYKGFCVPPYACVPERATLILPPAERLRGILGDDVAPALESRFRQGWRSLWQAIRAYAEERAKDEEGELVWKFIARVFSYYDCEYGRALFHEVPPLLLRVAVVEVELEGQEYWRTYSEKYNELASRLAQRKYKRVEPEAELQVGQLTEAAFAGGVGFPRRSPRGFEYCTSCGRLPALLVLPSGEGERPEEEEYGFYVYGAVAKGWESADIGKLWRRIREAAARGEKEPELDSFTQWLENYKVKIDLRGLKTIFAPGERLCAWCFAKRVLSLEPRLLNVLLLGKDEEYARRLAKKLRAPQIARFGFPSTPDVASLRLREKLVESVGKGVLPAQSLQNQLKAHFPLLLEVLRAAASEARPWLAEMELEREIGELKLSEDLKILLLGLLKADAETLWFSSDRELRTRWSSLIREWGLAGYLWSYYGIVRADGDNIGKLLVGDVSALHGLEDDYARLGTLLASILRATGSREFEKLLAALLEEDEERWQAALEHWSVLLSEELNESENEVRRRLTSARQVVEGIRRKRKIPVSISYHFSISSALSRIAILEAVAISRLGGFIVYAGGDDLMAFAPVDSLARLVYVSRRIFAGAPLDKCCVETTPDGEVRASTAGEQHESEQPCLTSGGIRVSPEKGFIRVNNAWLPALPCVGRSYCALLTHYLYPLHLALNRAGSALEDAKSRVRTRVYGKIQEVLVKDTAAFVYVPRGGVELSFVPLTLNRGFHVAEGSVSAEDYLCEVSLTAKAVDGLLRSVSPLLGEQLYSTSLLYDVESVNNNLVEAARRHVELVGTLMDFVLKRNLARGRERREAGRIRWNELSELICELDKHESMKFRTSVVEAETGGREEAAHIFTAIVRSARNLRGGMR
ncbi:MAG: type III-B CRISPR-associated protein Cas10/Cmr2, partial [Thermofilaceae archaeon]